MLSRFVVIVAVTLLLFASGAKRGWAQQGAGLVFVPNGFLTALDFRYSPTGPKQGWAMGFVDGMFLAPVLGAPARTFEADGANGWLHGCLEGMTSEQIAAISQYVEKNPQRWDQRMNIVAVSALLEACAERGYPRREGGG